MPALGFQDLLVWQKAVDLIKETYRLSRRLPVEERYGIAAQLRRSAVSVSSNIAEGSGRATTPDLKNFLSVARGSLKETESLILVCLKLDYFSNVETQRVLEMCDELSRMLIGLRSKLPRRPV